MAESSPSPVPSPSRSRASSPAHSLPQVQQKSSLLTYLELCDIGHSMRINILDDMITKERPDNWSRAEESGLLTSLDVVEAIRFAASEDNGDLDLDKIFAIVEPLDVVAVKRERAQDESDSESDKDDKPQPKMGMKLADVIDLDDEAAYTAVPDAGAQQVCPLEKLIFWGRAAATWPFEAGERASRFGGAAALRNHTTGFRITSTQAVAARQAQAEWRRQAESAATRARRRGVTSGLHAARKG